MGRLTLQSMDLEMLLSSNTVQLKHVVTVNSEIFVYAHENPAFQEILENTVNTIDGRVVWQMCSLMYPGRPVRKMSGSDFIYNLAEHAARNGEPIFLLGADPQANCGAVEALKAKHPGLNVAGYSPAFSADIREPKWNEEILGKITDFRPKHLVVCFGPMKQEMWIAQNADLLFRMGVRCAYGLGGTLDFVSGRKKRAPRWTQRVGVEWLYRVFTESGRIGRTAKMFKMPYFALRYFGHECELIPAPEHSVAGQ